MINKYLCHKVIWSSSPLSCFLPSPYLTLYEKFKKKRELGAGEGDRKEGRKQQGREGTKEAGREGWKGGRIPEGIYRMQIQPLNY